VAYYLDRYGYEVLPIAMRMQHGGAECRPAPAPALQHPHCDRQHLKP